MTLTLPHVHAFCGAVKNSTVARRSDALDAQGTGSIAGIGPRFEGRHQANAAVVENDLLQRTRQLRQAFGQRVSREGPGSIGHAQWRFGFGALDARPAFGLDARHAEDDFSAARLVRLHSEHNDSR
jgi:hypothetical protein